MGIDSALAFIKANRQNYDIPFAAGTPTLDYRKYEEDQRQFDEKMGEEQRQFDFTFGENKRQFDQSLARDWAALSAKGEGGSGGGGGASPDDWAKSAGERSNVATAQFINYANNMYKQFRDKGEGHPLYMTIEQIFTNPEFNQWATEHGVDKKTVVDSMINQYGGPGLNNPGSYFQGTKGQGAKAWYDALSPGGKGGGGELTLQTGQMAPMPGESEDDYAKRMRMQRGV